jgi:hypothetical protein
MAKADSQSPMISNLSRFSSLFIAFYCALLGKPLWTLAAASVVGELVALLTSFYLLKRRQNLPWYLSTYPALFATFVIMLSGLSLLVGAHSLPFYFTLIIAFITAFSIAGLLLYIFPESRLKFRVILKEIQTTITNSCPSKSINI